MILEWFLTNNSSCGVRVKGICFGKNDALGFTLLMSLNKVLL